jgi:hypothetical protein
MQRDAANSVEAAGVGVEAGVGGAMGVGAAVCVGTGVGVGVAEPPPSGTGEPHKDTRTTMAGMMAMNSRTTD